MWWCLLLMAVKAFNVLANLDKTLDTNGEELGQCA